jgi:flagellar biosynthesis anti-sigma factor FlgM
MSIDPVNISNQGVDRAKATQANKVTHDTDKDQQVVTGSDAIASSPKAKELEQLASTIDQSRTEHLDKVREALESGTYHVSAKAIAQGLIDANKK